MSLKDILAARKAGKMIEILPKEKEGPQEPISIIPSKEDISYLYQPSPYEVDENYFINCYSIYFLHPYEVGVSDWRFLRNYLLDKDFYILNTFSLLPHQQLFDAYMKHKPPRTMQELHMLYMCISELHLHVPGKFLAQIIELLEKNPD